MSKRLSRSAKAGLVLLFLACLGVGAWLAAKPLVELLASRAIGHPVSVAGELHLHLFPQPGLSASRIVVAAPDWSARDDMLRVARLSFSLDPGALLRGRLVVDEARIASPVLFVERTAQGRLNWGQGAGAAQDGTRLVPDLPLVRQLVLDDAQLIYYGHGQGRFEGAIRHAVWHKQHNGPGTLKAGGSVEGSPWSVQLRLSPTGQEGPGQRYALAMQLDAQALDATVQGRLGWPLAAAATDLRLRVEGAGPAPLEHVALGTRLQGRARQWQLSDLRLQADDSVLQGELALDAGSARPTVSGKLVLTEADAELPDTLKKAWKQLRADREPQGQFLERLRQVDAHLQFAVAPTATEGSGLEALRMNLDLVAGVLTADPLVLRTGAGGVQASLRLDARSRPAQGRLQAVFEDLSLAPLAGAAAPRLLQRGQLQGTLTLAFTTQQIKQVQARLRYRARPDTEVRLQLASGGPGKPAMRLAARGRIRGAALRLEASGDPLALMNRQGVAPFELEGRLGATRIEASGRMVAADNKLAASIALSGPGSAALERLLGVDLPRLPAYAASARLVLDDGGMVVDDARVRIGRSRFRASGRIDDLTDPRSVRLRLRAKRLVLSDFRAFTGSGSADEAEPSGWPALALDADLHVDLDVQAERVVLAEDTSLRDVRIDARLHDGHLVVRKLHAEIGGGSIAAEGDIAGIGGQPRGRLQATVRDVRLGNALRPLGLKRAFPGTLDGKLALAFGQPGAERTLSTLRYRAPQNGSDVRISLRQTPGQVRFALRGRYRNESVRLHGSAAPLRRLVSGGRYPFKVEFMALATEGRITGSLAEPLQLDGLAATLTLSGPNPRKTEPVLGFRVPELPPYRLTGRLVRKDEAWTFGPFHGSVGNTDLSGRIVAKFPKGRPTITARLHSTMLDLDDLGGAIGGAPGARPGDVASNEQRRKSEALRRRGRVLPDGDFELDELARMDATVIYTAERVDTEVLPVGSLHLRLSLSGDELAVSPLKASIAGGTLTAHLRMLAVAGERPPRVHMEMGMADVRLGPVLKKMGAGQVGTGRLDGYAGFDSRGASVADILASADGGLRLSLEDGGTLDALLVELAGLDLGESTLRWLGEERRYPVRCALVQGTARNGILDLDGSTLDTSDTRFTMSGQVRFPRELWGLRIEAHPVDPSLLAARAPLLVEGSFKNPDFHPSWAALGGRAALAGALAMITPPAALLAFVEPGLGEHVPCGQAGK